MTNLEIQIWRARDKSERWEELLEAWFGYWVSEPLFSAVIELAEEENKEPMAALLKDYLPYDNTPCIVAWDTDKQKVAGFIICVTCYPEGKTPQELEDESVLELKKYLFKPEVIEKISHIGAFLGELIEKADVFKWHKVDKLINLQDIMVLPEYAGQGIATAMIAAILKVAKEDGYKLATSQCTSTYSQHITINKFDFESILEVEYDTGYKNFHLMPADVKDCHKKVVAVVKKL